MSFDIYSIAQINSNLTFFFDISNIFCFKAHTLFTVLANHSQSLIPIVDD